jgi:hypothetical protein
LIENAKNNFNKLLKEKFSHIKTDLPLFFVSNKNKTGIEEIHQSVVKMDYLKSEMIEEFKKFNQDTPKKEKDMFILKCFEKSIEKESCILS